MKNVWTILRFGMLLFALPLVATAAVSASQWIHDDAPIEFGADSGLSDLPQLPEVRMHAVALNANGTIQGRVSSRNYDGSRGISNMTVFFIRGGEVIKEVMTTDNGSFVVQGLEEGPYTFVATGSEGFAAYGISVISEPTEGVDNVIRVSAVTPKSSAVNRILGSSLPSKVVAKIGDNLPTTQPIMAADQILLQDGKLEGQLFALTGAVVGLGTTVHIFQGDSQVAEVETDENGRYSVPGLAAGIYGFVAVGPNGIAAISFEAVDSLQGEIAVSLNEAGTLPRQASSLDMVMGETGDVSMLQTDTYASAPIEYSTESIACGGACGASAGSCGNYSSCSGGCGGGSAGGIGRLGRLALIGGAVAGIIALATDSDKSAGSNVDPS